jgi:outer membrane protein assembly factor BamB
VVAADLVFVPTWSGLVALSLDSGEVAWRVGSEQPWAVAPAVHDGTAYVGYRDETGLVALDVRDGSERWRLDTRGDVHTPPTFDYDHRWLYVGDDTGRVYQVDPASGETEHTVDLLGAVTALASRFSLVVGTEGGEVYQLYEHRDTLMALWRRKLGGAVTDISLVDTTIAVSTFGGPLYRLQDGAHAGSSRWEYDRGAIHLAMTDYGVFGTDGGGLRAVDARTGDEQWTVDGSFDCGPAVAGDTLYVGGGESGEDATGFVEAYALDGGLRSFGLPFGGRRWRYEVDSAVGHGLAVADGAVFAVTYGGKGAPARAHALDPA